MEEQLQNTSLNQISKNNEVPNAEITKDLPYIPIEEMFNTPEYDTYIDTMDLAQIQQLNADSQTINKYAAPAMGNMASTRPTLATTTFDPLLQKDAQKFENTATSFARMMNQSSNAIKEKYTQSMQPGTFLPSPIAINIKNSNFDRYYNHPKYAELGFSPYANNEEYYNKNSTAADDRTRMWVQFNNLVGTGFMSGYRSIADLFGGDPGAPDLQSATEMEDAMRIGSTSRVGTRASFDNLVLNSGYTFGVISSIAVEELALFGIAAIQGGLNPASDAMLASRTATNASRLSRAVNAGVNSFTATRALNYTRDMFRQMNNLDNAKDFYNGATATGTFVGKLFFPETVAAIKNIKTVQNGAQNMSNMAKVSSSFGGFYRDLRSLNYALAESKLESGMVYNQRMTDNIKMQISKNNGGNVTPEQMLLIEDNASKAGFATLQMNAPIIFLSNQLVLGNAFGGFKRSFSNMVNDNLKGISRRIIQTGKVIGPDGKLFQDVGSGLRGGFNRIKTLGVKGGLKTTAGASLRYFSANFSEGVQEVAQEAISHGVNHYYEALFNNPLAGGIDLQNESLNSAISSQFSEQGFETFMSGFLMGGLVQGPQKIFFQGVPSVYKFGLNQAGIGIGTKSQKEAWAEYKGNREKLINTVLESRNKNWNENIDNPGLLTDPHKYNFLIQKEANGQKIKSAYDNDIFGFQDATDLAKFQQMQTMFDTGGTKAYVNQLNSYIQLSDEDLLGAFPEEKDNIKNGKLRTRFQDSIDQINKNETIYIRDKNDNPNLNDPSQFKVGSREWQKAVLKYRAFEHMRYLKMFTKDGFNQALKRSSSIYESLASEPMFDKMNTSDITVLLDLDSIDNELYILSQELDILILDKKTNSKAIDKKQGKFDRLETIRKVLTNPKNLSKDGTYDRKNISALSDVFKNYVKFLANSNDSFVDQNVIDDVLEKMVDYKALKGRAKLYDKTIEAFANPNKLDEVLDRIYALQNDQLNNIEENYKKVIENYLKTHEMNELLNQIANIDGYEIIPDPDQTKLFLETGDARYLTDFYVENVGLITSENNPILYNIIQNLKQTYIGIQNEEALDKEKISEDEINQELKNEISDLLKNTEGIDETLVFSNSKKYNELLVNLYNEYTFKQTAANKEVLTLDEWKNTEQAENFRNAFNKLKQVWIANDKLINEANPLTEEEILDDNKFINWLLSDEGAENDLVDTILSILNVNIADITGQSEAMNPEGNFLNGSTTEKIIKKALSYSIIQVPIREVDGTDSFRYKIYDNKTKKEIDFDILKEFTDGDNLFSSFNDADKILVQLEETFGDKKSFQFEGITLKYGMIVYDKTTGVKYQILSKSKEINNGADLTLLPSDKLELSNEDRVKFFEYVPEGSFKLGYILQDVDTALRKLGPNVSRLNVSEPVTPFGYQNKGETKSESVIRYNTILSVLTEDEIKNLEFIVSLDPLGGQNKKLYSYIDQEPNPSIVQMRSKYRIGIKTSNLETQNKINTELKKRNIALSADQDNVFAFINVNGFLFKDANGKELNPLNFTEEQINDIFRTPDYLKGVESSAQLLKTAQKNFASNRTLTKALDESMKDVADGEKISIPISTLSKGISLVMKPGSTVYDDSARGLNDLDYSTVDNEGNYLIYKLYTLNGKTTITPITNLIGDERIALLEKVEKGLTDQKLFNDTDGGELQNGKIDPTTGKIINDALKAVVLLPNGKYTLVNLKAAVLPQSERDLIFLDFITKAQDVIANKKEIFGGQKDDSTNIDEKAKATIALREFNKTQAGKFYISITPGYNISMQVTPWGKIQLELIKDKKSIFKADLDTKTILSTDENLSINNKIQKLLNKFNEKVGEKKLEINELTNNNFRKSFDKDAQIEVLLAKTQTNVKKEVSSPSTVTLFTDSSINQAEVNMNATTAGTVTLTESFTDAEGTPIPKGPEMTTSTTQFESTVDNTIAADYLMTGGFNTILSTDYLLKGIAGFFTNANAAIDKIRNKYAKELADKNLVDIKNFIGTETYNKILLEIKEALNKTYNNSTEIQNILLELLKAPTGMPQRIGLSLESRHNAELTALKGQEKVTPNNESKIIKLKEQLNKLKSETNTIYNQLTQKPISVASVGQYAYYIKRDGTSNPPVELQGVVTAVSNNGYKVKKSDGTISNWINYRTTNDRAQNPYNMFSIVKLTENNKDEIQKLELELTALEGPSTEEVKPIPTTPASDIKAKKADIENNDFVVKIKKIGQSYAGGKQFVNTKQTGKEFLEQLNYEMYGEKVQPEHLLYFKDKFGGQLYDLINRGYKELTGKTFEEYDAELTAFEGGIAVVNLGQPVSEIKVTKSPLANVLEKINTLREKLQEGLKGKAKVQALTENKEYNALLEERDRLTGGVANKILAAMTSEDIEDINVFVTWANANLPESITIQDIALLGNNLKAGGIRIGAFVLDLNAIAKGETIKGTIYTGAKSLFRYHEAFHSVFRMLLSDAEITKYLSIARKEVRAKLRAEGKNFNTELELFRRSADTYTNMSDARLKQEYYEEYLADKFDAFKVNPRNTKTSSEIKSLFARILDWIKAVFSSYNTGELQTLFENIDSGKYVNANIVANQFTSQVGITLEANALIPYENIIKSTEVKDEAGNVVKDSDNKIKTTERIGFLYLDSAIADPMIASMAAMYLQRVSENTDPLILRSELLDDIIQDFEILYDPTEDNNLDKSEEQKVLLNQTWLAITGYKSTIKKQVYAYLNIIDSQVAEEEYNEEFFEMTVGLRGIDQWDTDASMIGSVNSTPKAIRAYIATTTIAETDFFGNMFLTEKINENGEIVKERLIIPVNFNAVYNGLLKSVKNIEDPKAMLQNMYFFGLQNPETGAVVSRLLTDIGISQDLLLSNDSLPIQLKNASLFQSFTKAFENFRVDYLFTQRDPITGNVLWYSAAERDDINSQMVAWSQAWTLASKKLKSNKTRKNALLKTLDKFEAALITDKVSGAEEAVKDSKLINDSKEYAENIFEYTGIKLSTQFIQFSLSKNKNENETTFYQKALLNTNKQEAGISADDIGYMRQLIQLNEDIFSEDQKGINSRIKNLAIRNAPFDETIGGSVFKNAEGNFVYAHQKPTNHLKQIQKLNDVAYLELLKEQKPYLKNNHLLNNEAFMQMSNENRQKILRIAGASVGKINDTEGDINDNISGVSSKSDYGNFTPQEFALSLINSYAALVNTKSGTVNSVEYYDEVQEKDITVALAPVLIRVIEAANTGDLTSLPVVETVKFLKGNSGESILTDEVLDIFTTSIKTEFDRIRRENNEDTKTEREIIGYNVDAYNKEKNKVTRGRAYELHNSTLLLDPIIKEDLEKIANRDDASFEEALSELGLTPAQFKKQLNDILDSQFNEFVKELDSLNIDSDISNSVKVGLTGSKEFIQSNRLLNLSTDKTYNLKQIFFNDWINTKAINEILLGDQAVTLKNGVDAIKRAKAENAATISAYSAIADPEKGVMHPVDKISAYVLEEPIGVSSLTGKNIDKADAILYYTSKGLRYTEFGFGTLTPMQADLIDRLEAGENITEEEIFGENGFVANGAMLNSRKLVYADGTTFIKMSAFPLIPQLTSNNIETDPTKPPIWVAKENRKTLHNLRIKLEKQEAKSDVIAIAAPLTAYKMLKQDVTSLSELGNENDFTEMSTELSAKSLGLQVANPSNKMEVIDPTQIKNIVTSEQNDSEFVKALDMTVGQIRTAYNLATSRRVVLKFKNKRNLTFSFDSAMDELEISKKKGEITPNLMAFLKFAQSGLKASQSSSQLLEFFSTKDGEQQYNLNNPITINKFESLFLSYLSKGTLAEKLPGHALALVSDFGVNVYRRVYEFDENGIPLRSEIIRQNVWERKQGENSYTNNTIVESNQSEGEPSWKGIKVPKEGVVIMDRLRTNVREFNSNGEETGQRYTETLMPAHFAEIMTYIENTNQPMPEVIAKMFAIRIPSQDNHSTINSKIVDFLPAVYGSVAMFAQELVEISGADFDIDKVYSQIKEWYVKDKKFYEYGSATTDKEAYSDYLTYIQSKVDKKGSVYNEALMLFKEDNQLIKEDNPAALTFADSMTDEEYKKWANTIIALEMLSLPISLEQYITYKKKNGEPYEAPLNNRLLDLKYALMGNNAVTNEINGNPPISYTPASIDILQNLWDEFSDNTEGSTTRSNYMVERSREDNIDIDNTLGKIKAWKANKGAAIGAIVSPNVNLSLLTEYKIELKSNGPLIIINGVEYNTFAHLREQLSKTVEGERKQDIISTLITMATDNAKERLVAKLGLNREALSLVGNLTALGMPIKTSILLINNPKIQNIYDQALNKKEKMDPGVESLIKKAITELYEKLEGDEESTSFDVTDELLRKALDNEITDAEQLSIFIQFSEALKVKNFTSNMKAISDLTNGLGKDISTVNDKKEKINKLFAEDAIMDLSPIYKSDTWQSTYLKIFNQIYDDLLPVTFLTASPQFVDIMDSILESIDVKKQEFTSETQSKIARDLLSYVTIKAYQHNGGNGTTGSVANLNNNFIYPSDQNSVVDLIEKLRKTEVGKNNFFLDVFAVTNKASETNNNTGLNLVESNTFRSLNGQQKVDLQTSFAKLYGTLETKDDALSIVNYMMVKDGLQITYGTLLDAVSPFVMRDYLDHIETANEALRDASNEKMKSVFGLTMREMKAEFITGYLSSNRSNALLLTFEINSIEQKSLPQGVIIYDGVLTISYEKNLNAKDKLFVRIKSVGTDMGGNEYTTYKTYMRNDLSKSIFRELIPESAQLYVKPVGEIKEGVAELFESNPELANEVYEALGFDINTLSYLERAKKYKEFGIKKSDGTEITEEDIKQNPTFYQNNTDQSTEKYIASEKTIRDLAARMSDRIGMPIRFESDRTKDYKGKIENGVAYINLAYATLDTPIHEILGHPIIRAIKGKNKGFVIDGDNLINNKTGEQAVVKRVNEDYDFELTDGRIVSSADWQFKTNPTYSQLYQNLLKELETGKGKEVLDRIKRDYVFKENKNYEITLQDGKWWVARNEGYGSFDLIAEYDSEKEAKESLPKYSLEEQQEEAIVELLGMMTAGKLDAVKDGKLISLLKRLLKEMKQFIRSLINQKEVEIDKLPDNMTLGDLSDLLAYSNSKLILPGNEVIYTTPDNQTFKTYKEASNHISDLAKDVKDVDLDKPMEKYAVYFSYMVRDSDGGYDEKPQVEYFNSLKEAEDYSKKIPDGLLEKIEKTENFLSKEFIDKNKEYEQSKEIIEEWKKVNNIQYNPEEIYSRGQEFSSVVGAYSNFDVDLMMQNLLQHIEDNKKAGGKFAISSYTKPTDRKIGHLEGGGGRIKFKLYPQSEDILWASNTDVYSGSVWDASEKVNKDKKSELLGVSYTKYPSINNVNSVQPNLAAIVDNLAHHHNELGITLTGNNFRLEYDENIPYTTKKIIDGINKILDQKYGKLVKPEIRNKINKEVIRVELSDPYETKLSDKIFTSEQEAKDWIKKESEEQDRYYEEIDQNPIYKWEYKIVRQKQGIQPTQTNETLKESIESIKNKTITPKLGNWRIMPGPGGKGMEWAVEYILENGGGDLDFFSTEKEAQDFINSFKNATGKEKEYTSQALINTKIAKLKEVAKKYPRSLIRSEVRPYKSTNQVQNLFDIDELAFQLVGDENLTPKQQLEENIKKQQALQAYSQYLNTGKQDIEGFKEFVTQPSTQLSTSVNPLVEAGVKATDMYGNAAKDIQMADESTQFIGFGTIMKEGNVSSTDKYAKAWGNKANTGVYSSGDTIMVSGSGNFGRGGVDKTVEAQAIRKTLTEKYKPLLDKAIAAGASFRIGNQYSKGNLSDQLIADYLQKKGYTEEKLNGYSKWTSSTKVIQLSTGVEKFSYARTANNSYEVSTAGDSRFSALNAKLKDGRTIEEAYQLDIKGYRKYKPGEKVDARTAGEFTSEDKNGKEIILDSSKAIIVKEDTQDPSSVYINIEGEEYSVSKREIIPINPSDKNWKNGKGKKPLHGYSEEDNYFFYKDLWSQWAEENPSLLEDLRQKAQGKVLTDKFASSPVSQARALADILNETTPFTQPSTSVKQPIQLISEVGFYKGIPIIDTENITTAEGTKGAASYSSKNNSIKINRALLKKKYAAKVWTNMRELIETLHGEEVKSKAENLPANSFNTYEEFEMFVIEHEYQHSLYTRKDFNEDFPNGTKGEYETAINNKALNSLSQPIQQSNIGSYIEIGTSGSNQQWAGGFMFGSRPTYKETRDYVKNKPLNIAEDDFQNLSDQFDELNAQLEDELRRSDTTNIVMGTPSEGGTKVIINLEEKAPLIESVPDYIENQEDDILDDALFDAAKLEKELYEDAIEFDSEDLYPQLTIFWDEVIQQDSEKKAKFVANGIGTYDRMIKFFKEESEKGMYPATAEMTSEEVFIEEIKCIL